MLSLSSFSSHLSMSWFGSLNHPQILLLCLYSDEHLVRVQNIDDAWSWHLKDFHYAVPSFCQLLSIYHRSYYPLFSFPPPSQSVFIKLEYWIPRLFAVVPDIITRDKWRRKNRQTWKYVQQVSRADTSLFQVTHIRWNAQLTVGLKFL